MTIVRIVPWPGGVPDGSVVTGQHLVVLADDTGHRAVPLWLRVSDPKSLWHLLADRPAGDAAMAGVLQETAARLLHAAGVRVTAVDIEVTAQIPPDANRIIFGVFLTGRGQVELRNPELEPHPANPQQQPAQSTKPTVQ